MILRISIIRHCPAALTTNRLSLPEILLVITVWIFVFLNLNIQVNLYYDKRAKLKFYQLDLIKNLTLKIMFTIIFFIVNVFLIKRPLVVSICSFSFSTHCYFIWYLLFSLYLFIYHQYHYYFPFRSYCYFSNCTDIRVYSITLVRNIRGIINVC